MQICEDMNDCFLSSSLLLLVAPFRFFTSQTSDFASTSSQDWLVKKPPLYENMKNYFYENLRDQTCKIKYFSIII